VKECIPFERAEENRNDIDRKGSCPTHFLGGNLSKTSLELTTAQTYSYKRITVLSVFLDL
jgi:hypothetical protein